MLVPFDPPHSPTAEASERLREYVFYSNLASQEATGDVLASVSAPRVVKRLFGSTESRAELLAYFSLIDDFLPTSLATTADQETEAETGDTEVSAWVWISYPLLEDTDSAHIEITLSIDLLPMPGQDPAPEALAVWNAAFDLAAQHIVETHRRKRIYITCDAGWPIPDHCETRVNVRQFSIEVREQKELIPPGYSLIEVDGYGVDSPWKDQIRELLTQSSADQNVGSLELDTVDWTHQRLHNAHTRLQTRGVLQKLFLLVNDAHVIDSLGQLSTHTDGDPRIAELGVIAVRRGRRGLGLAPCMMRVIMHAAHENGLHTLYTTASGNDDAADKLLKNYSTALLTHVNIAERKL